MLSPGTRQNSDTIKRWRFSDFLYLVGIILIPLGGPLLFRSFWNIFKERKDNNFVSKVVVITGASSGLGEALAHVFYKAGCKVVLAARREAELQRVYNDLLSIEVQGPNYPPTIIKLDLEELESLPSAINKILKIHERIDILINNGGISLRADISSTSIDVDVKVMQTNYFGAVALTKAVLPSMIRQSEGRIVFISSVQGKFALPFRSAYSASKHAIQAFSDSLRAEVFKDNIKVTCISPGYIKTSLSENALTNDGTKYGKTDPTTANGISPETMAKNILISIQNDDKDVIFAQFSAKLAYWLRFCFPSIYFWLMKRRAAKV